MAKLTEKQKSKILELRKDGVANREIARQVLGKESRESSIRSFLKNCGCSSDKEGAKILFIDIETSAAHVLAFGRWKVNISQAQVLQESMLLGFCAKWGGSDHMIEVYPEDVTKWDSELEQRKMLEKAHMMLSEADIVCAHNSDKFDIPYLNAQLIKHGFFKPAPYKTVDTLKIAKYNFRFPANRLDSLGEFLGLGRKLEHSGFSLWRECMMGDKKAWRTMIDYNIQDVVLLEEVYKKLRSWGSHPNIALCYDDADFRCGVCGSKNLKKSSKKAYTNCRAYDMYQCKDCGTWTRVSKACKGSELRKVK